MNKRLYHLIVKKTDGQKVYLTAYPATHEECRVIKSKQSDRTINRVQFEEIQQ